MDLNLSLDPHFLSDLDTFPVTEVGDHVETVAREGSLEALENLTSSLIDRALRALRTGSQQDLLEEALAVSQGLSGEAGDALRKRHPWIFGAWTALDDLLAEAGRRHDRAAVPGILKSTGKHGRTVLEILAREGKPVPRADILMELQIGESHLSHLLHHLEEADLVVRFRQGKQVHVELGPVGKDFVETAVFPTWMRRLEAAIQRIEDGEEVAAQELTKELVTAGAPSRPAADLISAALERLAKRQGALSRAVMLQLANQCSESYKSEDSHYLDVVSSLPPSGRPSQAFASN